MKGVYFWLNLVVLYFLILLIIPLFGYKSWNPVIFGYSLKYLLYLGFFVSLAIGFLILIILKRFNRKMFFMIVFLLISGEIFLSYSQRFNSFSNDIHFYPKPYVMFGGKPNSSNTFIDKIGCWGGGEITVKLNESGFRGKISKQKPKEETRIILIGGSTAFNGYPLSNSISGQLEKLYHKAGYCNIRVYNFSVVGYTSGQELSLLLHTVVDYKPDIVIVFDGGNDMAHAYSYDPRPGNPFNFMVYEAGLSFMQNKLSFNQVFVSILNRSKLIQIIFKNSVESHLLNLERIRKQADYKSEAWEKRIVLNYTSNLEKMRQLSKGFDFKLVVFLQPVIYHKSPLVGKESNFLTGREFQDYMKRQYERIGESLNQKNYFFNLSQIFKDYNKEIFWDFIHVNNEGNKFIAEKIYECLKKT